MLGLLISVAVIFGLAAMVNIHSASRGSHLREVLREESVLGAIIDTVVLVVILWAIRFWI